MSYLPLSSDLSEWADLIRGANTQKSLKNGFKRGGEGARETDRLRDIEGLGCVWEGGWAGDKEVEVININCGCSISSEKDFWGAQQRWNSVAHVQSSRSCYEWDHRELDVWTVSRLAEKTHSRTFHCGFWGDGWSWMLDGGHVIDFWVENLYWFLTVLLTYTVCAVFLMLLGYGFLCNGQGRTVHSWVSCLSSSTLR